MNLKTSLSAPQDLEGGRRLGRREPPLGISGAHHPGCVGPSCSGDVFKAKELVRHRDDATIGEKTRRGTQRCTGRVLRATLDWVKLRSWQAPRVEAQGEKVHVRRVDVCAVNEAIGTFIRVWVRTAEDKTK